MSKIKAVLFDYDGTLMNTNGIVLGSWYHTYDTVGVPRPSDEHIASSFGEMLKNTMTKEFPDRDADEMVAIYRSYQQHIFSGKVYMFPGMEELVNELKAAGYKTAIVTSRMWSSTTPAVYDFPIADHFDAIVSMEDTPTHKPDPTCILLACEKLGITPDEAIYVGDSRFDVHCAKNAGMKSVIVEWTICLPKEQRTGNYAPDFTVEKPCELFEILNDLNKGE